MSFVFLEVQAGFEPADNGVADRGLTTWLLHQSSNYPNIIAKIFGFVKGKSYNLSKDFVKGILAALLLLFFRFLRHRSMDGLACLRGFASGACVLYLVVL